MPQITLTFASDDAIPAELRQYKTTDNKVTIWAGDKVAEETNAGLAANRDKIKGEKEVIEAKYNALVSSSNTSDLDKANIIAENERLKKTTATPEDLAIVQAVKAVDPTATAETVKTKLAKLPELETKVQAIEAREQTSKHFALSGFKNETVFQTVLNNKDFNPNLNRVFSQNVKEGNNTVEKLYAEVKQSDNTVKTVLFADYVKENTNWNPFLPALNAGGEQSQQGRNWISQTAQPQPIITGDGKPAINIDNVIAKENEIAAKKPNPLFADKTAEFKHPALVPQT